MWVKMTVEGRENLDGLDGPALYVFNHSDDFDGPVVYQALPRQIRRRLAVAAADDVMREHKVLAFIVRFCFAGFNLARTEPYMPSLEYVGTLVDRGWSVALAPEGRLSTDGVLAAVQVGHRLAGRPSGGPGGSGQNHRFVRDGTTARKVAKTAQRSDGSHRYTATFRGSHGLREGDRTIAQGRTGSSEYGGIVTKQPETAADDRQTIRQALVSPLGFSTSLLEPTSPFWS